MPLTDLRNRAARSARRLLNDHRPTGDVAVDEAAVREARRRAKRLKSKLAEREAEVAELRAEVLLTRNSVRNPDPRVSLPAQVIETIERVQKERLSYLHAANLEALARIVITLEQQHTEGVIIEAGTARGGSAIVMAAAKAPERTMKVYDVFGLIPAPSEKDGDDVHTRYDKIVRGESKGLGEETYYGYRDDLYAEVAESFARHGVEVTSHQVELVRGLFADTITGDEPVALAHLDGDWYESTMTCLERIAPRLVPGGRIVLDDYYAWSGCRTAVDEYFGVHRSGFQLERRAKLHVVRL